MKRNRSWLLIVAVAVIVGVGWFVDAGFKRSCDADRLSTCRAEISALRGQQDQAAREIATAESAARSGNNRG